MGLRSFIESSRRLLKLSAKPSRAEFRLIFKVTALGTLAIGLYSFLIMFVATVLSTVSVRIRVPPELPIYLAAAIVVLAVMVYAYGRRAGWW